MDRRSLLTGLVAGVVLAAGFSLPFSPLRPALAEDPPVLGPGMNPDPATPTTAGRTVNPIGGEAWRGPGGGSGGFGTTAANQTAIAISAPASGGENVVYYFDTVQHRLLVYQYRGGGGGRVLGGGGDGGGVRLLAARHFDYDLKLQDYRDISEKTRDQLKADYDAKFPPGKGGEADGTPSDAGMKGTR